MSAPLPGTANLVTEVDSKYCSVVFSTCSMFK